ncbi:MAG: hypothetical protein ABEJ72_03510 [Candidatus Aenigmatarchaeota archaeon]
MKELGYRLLLPAGSLLEFAGILTLITNDGMLMENVGIGFTVPAVLPVEFQGIGLLMAGGGLTVYGIMNMKRD